MADVPHVHARRLGRLAADERAAALCDAGTFVAEHARQISASPGTPLGDGIVVGVGLVAGRPVTVIANDGRVHRGALGAVGARIATRAIEAAVRAGRAIVLLIDCDGARVGEGGAAVLATADWLAALADASGHVPVLAAVLGVAGGAAAYAAALADLVVMVRDRSFAFVAGPPVIATALSEETELDALAGTRMHSRTSGLSHALAEDDRQALGWLGAVLSYLPANAWSLPERRAACEPEADDFALAPSNVPMDTAPVRAAIIDRGSWLELGPDFGASVTTGFARIDGRAVALVASQPMVLGGAIDHRAAQKLARFVRLAAAFNLPIVTLCDTPGFLPGRAEEAQRVLVHGAKVISAYAEARRSVPLIALITRRAIGAGSVLVFGADLVLALAGAEVLQMGREAALAAAGTAFADEPEAGPDAETAGLVQRVIEPRYARAELVRSLARLRAASPAPVGTRKHCLVPL